MKKYLSFQSEKTRLFKVPAIIGLVAVLLIFYDFGYNQNDIVQIWLNAFYVITLAVGIVSTAVRYIRKIESPPLGVVIFDIVSVSFFLFITLHTLAVFESFDLLQKFYSKPWLYTAIFLVFIREFAALRLNLSRAYLNPAQLFIISFLGIILLGSLLLLLPNATYESISFLNALFMSTSAVCVTGLTVIDPGSELTFFGQCILLSLIQIGGLGIMTFASYFSYFFRGSTTYENHLMLNDITSNNKLGEVFSTLKNIILVTFSIELIGAVIMFSNLDSSMIPSYFDRLFFAVFHSISAFCNAGFSLEAQSFYTEGLRFNYGLHSIALLLFIVGGLGFPIVFNLFKYCRYLVINRFIPKITGKRRGNIVVPWVLNLNSRITLITTFALLIIGSIVFFLFEQNNSLAEHSGVGKVITAIFSAATPRTAGFNVVDTSSLSFSTLMLIFLLMWIGASPASTGGGIKTSTFAIATLNFWSLARGKNRVEIFRRELSDLSIRRAFAIISLSLVAIGMGVFCIAYFDEEKDLLGIAFECFSAYSTVGLSVGITDELSNASRLVIIALMFTGRVSMLTLLIALFRKEKFKNYRYSKEEILIN